MRNVRVVTALLAVTIVCLLAASVAIAQGRLPKLPQPYTFAQSGDSPGKVTFNHASHVNDNAPGCTACHPRLFKILTAGAAADGKPITHDAMKQGRACGACHNGKKSFGVDDCTTCHRS
jgi:c(7)-type cytochrome triheme protein